MKQLEQYVQNKNLNNRASKLSVFDSIFLEDIKGYNKILMNSPTIQNYSYLKQNKEVYKFPVIGIIGQLGLANVWHEPFYTCCRYALMDEGYKELEEGELVLAELVDRVAHARKIIHTLPSTKQKEAQEKLARLSHLVNLIVAGLELFKDMLKTISGDKTSLDSKTNSTALVWQSSFH